MSLMLKITVTLAALYVLLVLAAYLGQRRLMYFPDPTRMPPLAHGLAGVEEQVIETPDGAQLIAWWTKALPGHPTLLYFHGNAGSLSTRAERIRRYQSLGRGVFMMSYRGYSGSTGRPSEAANVADARLVYQRLIDAGLPPRDIILYGESLGSGVAVQLAASRPVGGLILDAPYTSTVDVGIKAYPYLPVRQLMSDRYDSLSFMRRVEVPLLVVHGERDTVIPLTMGRSIQAAAAGPSEIVTFPLAGHADHHQFGSYQAINSWIDRLREIRPSDHPQTNRRD